MPRPLRIQFKDAYYHVMNRGTERGAIFAHDERCFAPRCIVIASWWIFEGELETVLKAFNDALWESPAA